MKEEKFTKGPWRWEVNRQGKGMQLCGGKRHYDLTVMDFIRWGTQSAQPRLRTGPEDMNIMKPANDFASVVEGREHHENWFRTLDHPDANLIAAAPLLYDFIKRLYEAPNADIFNDIFTGADTILKTANP